MYGSESRTISREMRNKLKVAEMWFERTVCQKWSKLVAGANVTMYVGATF